MSMGMVLFSVLGGEGVGFIEAIDGSSSDLDSVP